MKAFEITIRFRVFAVSAEQAKFFGSQMLARLGSAFEVLKVVKQLEAKSSK